MIVIVIVIGIVIAIVIVIVIVINQPDKVFCDLCHIKVYYDTMDETEFSTAALIYV